MFCVCVAHYIVILCLLGGQGSSEKATSGSQKEEGEAKKTSKVEKRGKKKGDKEQQKEKEKDKEGKVIYDRVRSLSACRRYNTN